jgi:hypothetical protein
MVTNSEAIDKEKLRSGLAQQPDVYRGCKFYKLKGKKHHACAEKQRRWTSGHT